MWPFLQILPLWQMLHLKQIWQVWQFRLNLLLTIVTNMTSVTIVTISTNVTNFGENVTIVISVTTPSKWLMPSVTHMTIVTNMYNKWPWWIFWYFDKCDQFWWKCDKCENFNTYELVTIVRSVTTCQVEFSITFSESFCKKDSTMLSFVPCVDFYKQMRSLKESKNPLVLRPPHCTFHSNNRLQTVSRCS